MSDPYFDAELNTLTRNQQRIIGVVRSKPGITKQDLIIKTRLNRKTLSYNLDRLLEQKLIWKVGGETGYEYITKDKLRSEIYNRLLMKLLSDEIDEETFLKIKQKLETLDIDEIQI
jgi:DNA-binding MarR family transcriptional regulator